MSIYPASLEWIKRLVEIDTVSRHSNLGLIELVRDELNKLNVSSTLTYHPSGKWANLFATIPGEAGETTGGIVLSGHTDVVPIDGQAWSSDPFKPEVRDGKLYGRGTCDMKGFIGSALSLVPEMQRATLKKPIHLALSYDEEVTCLGAPVMIEEIMRRGVNPDGCIVGEPTNMRPIIAHKGINAYQCCVKGFAAHSSLTPYGLNAIEYAARLICYIRDIADEFRSVGPFDELYDVPFTTAQASTIRGGNAMNTVPSQCTFEFEFRNLPGMNPKPIFERIKRYAEEELIPKMKAENSEGDIKFELISDAPGLDASEQAAITKLVRALTGDSEKRKVAYGTEAGQFQEAGVPSIICGPGDIQQAHKADEFVSLSQISECEIFMTKMIRSLEL